jgi:hypothetical protein
MLLRIMQGREALNGCGGPIAIANLTHNLPLIVKSKVY